jgi:hypothetical protein
MALKKAEGPGTSPWPVLAPTTEKAESRPRAVRAADPREPLCELCGHVVIASHCKRICLHCGFMTGCSEGI